MAKDLYHDAVKRGLEKKNWKITDDPLTLRISEDLLYHIDLAAEKYIVATKERKVIIVEVKSFTGLSTSYNFHAALGQYCIYKSALKYLKMSEELFLAVPNSVYTTFFQEPFIQQVLVNYNCKIISYHPTKKEIVYGNI